MRLGTSSGRLGELTLLMAMGLFLFGTAAAQDTIKAGEARAMVGGDLVLTDEGYAEYRKCIAAIPLGRSMEEYNAALNKCRENAKKNAFVLPQRVESPPTAGQKDWQTEELTRFKK